MKNLYKVLGVRRDATDQAIKIAYRKIARDTHPDYYPDDPAKLAQYKAATEAYDILSDPAKRAAYDRDSRPAASIQELLGQTVGGKILSAMLPHAPAARLDGEDQVLCICAQGGQVCLPDPNDPNGSIQVPLPPAHQMCRVEHRGAKGAGGGSPGALYIIPLPRSSSESA